MSEITPLYPIILSRLLVARTLVLHVNVNTCPKFLKFKIKVQCHRNENGHHLYYLTFFATVKAALHECVIRTGLS